MKGLKKYLILSFVAILQFLYSQQYPIRLIPVMLPPYSLKLGEYATSTDNKLQLQVLMTDLQQPSHQVAIKFFLEGGTTNTPIASSAPFIQGYNPFTLFPGQQITLSNVDLRSLFALDNLSGIDPLSYSKALPDGVYSFCFQAYDWFTKNNLSQKACAIAFFNQYEPPFLTLPQNGERIPALSPYDNGAAAMIFQWQPRQIAPNTRYIFTLKELWDLERDPISGFLAAPPFWQEEVFSPTLFYGLDKAQLIPGKRYAWQVQAKSGNPVYSASPTEDNGTYKNNGLSEIFYFDYTENCKTPSLLTAQNAGRGKVKIQWMLNGASAGDYNIQYRKRGTTGEWITAKSYQSPYFITGLEDLTEYEYRVGSVCGNLQNFNSDAYNTNAGNAYAYSAIQYFTTDSKDKSNENFQCGIMPAIDISNKTIYQGALGVNDVIIAGDFPVTITQANGIGNYSGEGYIVVPYLGDTKLKVSFNNIQINTDKKLIAGTIETTYDPSEKAVMFLSEGIGETFGDQGVKEVTVGYNISKVEYIETPPPGRIIIHGDAGAGNNNDSGSGESSQQELPGGRDYTIIDKDGNIYEIDEKGNVKEGKEKVDNVNSIAEDNVLINKYKELKFIYESNEYENGASIYKMVNTGDLPISIIDTKKSDLLKSEITWFFDGKEIEKGKELTSVKISSTLLKNKTYTLIVKKEKEEIAKLKIEVFKAPIVLFSLTENYDKSFMFDNEFVKSSNVKKDYERLDGYDNYNIPVLAVETNKEANLKLEIMGLPKNIQNMKDFEISIEPDDEYNDFFLLNNKNEKLIIKNTSVISIKPLKSTFIEKPIYLKAIYKNKIIGKLKVYSAPLVEKNIQIVFVKLGSEGYRDLQMDILERYLNQQSLNQIFIKAKLVPKKLMDLSTNENIEIGKKIQKAISNYTSSAIEGREIINTLLEKYKKENTVTEYEDIFFIINKSVITPDEGELGGIHRRGDIGGALFVYKDNPYEATAHEIGHWLNLRHTWDEGTPTKIPQGSTQNNFMDYNINRKSWFEFQLKKVNKK